MLKKCLVCDMKSILGFADQCIIVLSVVVGLCAFKKMQEKEQEATKPDSDA